MLRKLCFWGRGKGNASHDLIGNGAPVELILIEEDDDQSSLTYVRPSSLMVVEKNEPLLAAAKELDAKLQALAAKVTGGGT